MKNNYTCILHSHTENGWKSIQAKNPIEIFKGPLSKLDNFVKKHSFLNHPIIGYFSYDLGYQLHNIKKIAKNDLNLPDIYLLAFEQKNIRPFKANNTIAPVSESKHNSKSFNPTITKTQYSHAYNKIKHHIKEGDIYQINLTHRLEATTTKNPLNLFHKIIETNPVDHLAYIEGPNFEILSASPERFIKIHNNHIETCPIKGTRPRHKNLQKDQKLKKELLESKKEAAELNMITDLLRNDLGKVCTTNSVKVEGHRLIQACPTVWHTYSHITGKLKQKITPIQALISMLPGGSITGCPKKRAMEIIDKLEPTTRSVYTGVIGIIHPNQDLDFSIAIRTIIKKGDKLYLQIGGGIVLDSTSTAEYQETLDKAKSFTKIL
ncbi:MAG: aminodeoxychorismate synthase component I [Candidatus Peregrinibacteria bacterium]